MPAKSECATPALGLSLSHVQLGLFSPPLFYAKKHEATATHLCHSADRCSLQNVSLAARVWEIPSISLGEFLFVSQTKIVFKTQQRGSPYV